MQRDDRKGLSQKPMISINDELERVLTLAPEWRSVVARLLEGSAHEGNSGPGRTAAYAPASGSSSFSSGSGSSSSARAGRRADAVGLRELFERLGAKAVYQKLLQCQPGQKEMLLLIRDHFYLPTFIAFLSVNVSLRRFFRLRQVASDWQKSQVTSLAADLAQKMEGVLAKHLAESNPDGFKVLLPAYLQRSAHNLSLDFIKQEWQWEKATLQDVQLNPEMTDPREGTADDIAYTPEMRALSAEKVKQLNELRGVLQSLIKSGQYPLEPLQVVDMYFGLGLTPLSELGVETTMRECCQKLDLAGETQARKIARCQVLLDKGMDIIRQAIRNQLPGLAQSWQSEINVNSASRRELMHYLSLTEGEVERLVANRQYLALDETVEQGVMKAHRLQEIVAKGAVAAFVPVDVNSAPARDLIDILGLNRDCAQKIVNRRPLERIAQLVDASLLTDSQLEGAIKRGAVLKGYSLNDKRQDINTAALADFVNLGVDESLAARLIKGRPFATWSELEEYLDLDQPTWSNLRRSFCLRISG